MKHLWEVHHSYHCSSAYGTQTYDDFDMFLAYWGEANDDLNVLFRWDWFDSEHYNRVNEIEEGDEEWNTKDKLDLFFVLQRKGTVQGVRVHVDKADEARVKAWLVTKLASLMHLWEPIHEENNVPHQD